MAKHRPVLRDVKNLLGVREQVRSVVGDPDSASSVSAFISWKALLLASHTEPGADEVERLDSILEHSLRRYPNQLRPRVLAFVDGLTRLSSPDITPAIRVEWLRKQAWTDDELARRVDSTLRATQRLHGRLRELDDSELWMVAREVSTYLRHVRNIVVGHAQVVTSTMFFGVIVTPFEDLVAAVAELRRLELNGR